jgi:hypothetical protein
MVSHEGAGSEEANRDFAPGVETLRVGERAGDGATGLWHPQWCDPATGPSHPHW